MAKHTLSVSVDPDTLALLAVLGDPKQVLAHLVHSAADGVRRPGAWERGWLHQAFGNDFEQKLEQDPKTPFYQRPKAGPASPETN